MDPQMNPRPKVRQRAKAVPFEFVLDGIARLDPVVRPMFGCSAVYVGPKITFILRLKDDYILDNGVWMATTLDHHESLKKEFPSMRSITVFGKGPTGWQVLPMDSADFEQSVQRACELVLKGDLRIGKIPKVRGPKKKKK